MFMNVLLVLMVFDELNVFFTFSLVFSRDYLWHMASYGITRFYL